LSIGLGSILPAREAESLLRKFIREEELDAFPVVVVEEAPGQVFLGGIAGNGGRESFSDKPVSIWLIVGRKRNIPPALRTVAS
jgi:hypothetical protein